MALVAGKDREGCLQGAVDRTDRAGGMYVDQAGYAAEQPVQMAKGCSPRLKLSEQKAHSKPLTQMTGVRGIVSIARAICGTKAGPRPKALAVKL
jgi:hypothetical protein